MYQAIVWHLHWVMIVATENLWQSYTDHSYNQYFVLCMQLQEVQDDTKQNIDESTVQMQLEKDAFLYKWNYAVDDINKWKKDLLKLSIKKMQSWML